MSMLRPIRKTVDDYMAYDEERVELIDGEFLVSPSPSARHQEILLNLALVLAPQVKKLKIGKIYMSPFDVILSQNNVLQPDVLFLSNECLKRLRPKLEGPPDLAIEVLSKSHRKRDLVTKKKLYHEFRVPEYWIVDPEAESVTVFTREAEGWRQHGVFTRGESATSGVMNGVIAPVSGIFE